MEPADLIDTNVIIDNFGNKLPAKAKEFPRSGEYPLEVVKWATRVFYDRSLRFGPKIYLTYSLMPNSLLGYYTQKPRIEVMSQ